MACKSCGEIRRDPEEIRFDTVCARCGADLHSCAQCANFDTSARFECTQPIPARIPDKKKRNSCELYSAARSFDLTGSRPSATRPPTTRARRSTAFSRNDRTARPAASQRREVPS